jgi:DNA-directed RNA polymerase specialized sigma24 family protein
MPSASGSPRGSVTSWLEQLKAGDPAALQPLWERYFGCLVRLARKHLRGLAGGAADEEDVALSAFESFWQGVGSGRFPQLSDRDDLWQVLVVLVKRKASNLAKSERRQKRGGGKLRQASAILGSDAAQEAEAFGQLISREPDPEFAAQIVEQCRCLLECLADAELQSVAVWKMEGYTNAEIATRLGRSLSAVERKLRLIRDSWEKERLA